MSKKIEYKPYERHSAFHRSGEKFEEDNFDLGTLDIVVSDKGESFKIKLRDDFLSLHYYHEAGKSSDWGKDFWAHWAIQLNFAVHCSTHAIGVSLAHLNAKEPLLKALYRFHVYYHVRRILERMKCILPKDRGWDPYRNSYDINSIDTISREYGATTKSWSEYKNKWRFYRTGLGGKYMYNHQNWRHWIPITSSSFTREGLEKISESIRVYTYLILSSQFAARHIIVGDTGPAIAAQRIFGDNLVDAIDKSVSIQDDVSRYENVLKYASSKLDYSVGKGLYMLPSNMILRPLDQVINGYNEKLVISTSDKIGKIVAQKPTVHVHKAIQKPYKAPLQKDKLQAPLKSKYFLNDHEKAVSGSAQGGHRTVHKTFIVQDEEQQHDEEKQALIIFLAVGIGGALWYFK